MNATGVCKHDVSGSDWPRGPGGIQHVLTLTRQDRPSILSVGMHVCSDPLTWVDVPGDDYGFLRLRDDGADGIELKRG